MSSEAFFLTKQSLICDLIFAWTWDKESKCRLMKTFSVNLDVNNGFRFELNLIYQSIFLDILRISNRFSGMIKD